MVKRGCQINIYDSRRLTSQESKDFTTKSDEVRRQ